MRDIEQALAGNNIAAAQKLIHTLKGLAGSLGANQLQGHLLRLEESLAGSNTNAENKLIVNKLVTLIAIELNQIINSIQTTLPPIEVEILPRKTVFSVDEIQRQLKILLDKLQAFDSDADQQLELILSNITQPHLNQELGLIKKHIANYQFVDAANALKQILDFQTDET